ncbi:MULTISPECIES: sensor histidine kinase [Nonomuraea]|jgi:signal transduction histidine kinase|uniref:histidine kinase n=1 Tax=Nonomuraea ferruginea TaxID=46174 RepID=A0ABT4SQ29_9ACTN|nr:histidine kinase [Nonomuraea ferruginea]MDA0639184.1 histidine kinase [Nonomuraea ferruginea]
MGVRQRARDAWLFLRRPRVFDVTLVVVLAAPGVVAALAIWLTRGEGLIFATLYLITVPVLLMRRERPVLTAALLLGLDITATFLGVASGSPILLIGLYSLGRYLDGRRAAIAGGAGALLYAAALILVARPSPAGDPLGILLAGLFTVGIPVGLGQFVRIRAELRERAQREAADSAVRAERRRIARELHDVVAHHLSVINALVGGARATLPPEQEVARDALQGAEQTARQALAEMRQLLDVLRADGGGGADAATGVGTDRLPALVEEAGTAGLPARLTVRGEPVALPTAVDHAVYRIVQEALTNTRKHSVGARATVRLSYESAAIEVEVLDDGASKQPAAPAGFGLGGMAERVALCGGRLSTGPREEGGFRVHARIPLEKT